MLVKVRGDDPSRLSSTERTVVNWLKSWTGPHALPGIAVVKSRGADVVVWTPRTCVVVVVKGFTERVNGALRCSEAEPWTIDGAPAPLEDGQDGTGPMSEVLTRTGELERELRAAPGRESVGVMGIVLVIPQLGTRITLEKGALPPGIDVVVGDGPSSLRAYFTRITGGGAGVHPAAADSWDAAQVGQALGALGFAAAATYSDLIAEGFPAPREPVAPQPPAVSPIPASVPVASPHRPTPPPPRHVSEREFAASAPHVAPPQQAAAMSSGSPTGSPEFGRAQPYQATPQPYSVPFDPRPAPPPPRRRTPGNRRNRSIAPLILLAFLVVVLAVAAMCSGGGTSTKHTTPGGASNTPTLTTSPSFTTAPDLTIPSDTNGPACFPLQPCPGG